MKKIIFFLFAVSLMSCISKSDYDEVQQENFILKTKIEELEKKTAKLQSESEDENDNQLSKSNLKNQVSNGRTKYWADSKAEEFLKDYYDFYNRDYVYRNSRIRRIDDNTFKISLEECINKEPFKDDDHFWNASVLTLEIDDNGKYEMKQYISDL